MTPLSTLRWIGLALLGVALAGLVALLASNLASRQIGLASEPISAGADLAPAVVRNADHPRAGHGKAGSHQGENSGPTATPPASTEPEVVSPPVEATEQSGDGEHRDGGADD